MKKSTATINGEYLANLFEQKAEEILAKEKAPKTKKATKKVAEKSEVKEPKKKTIKAKAEKVEKVENSEKSQSTEKPKKVVKKATTKAVEKTAEKEPKKTTKKAKAEVEQAKEQEQKIRPLTTIKVAKTEYILDDNIKNYDDLEKAVDEKDIFVAFDISNVDSKEYENIFHTPFEKSMKEKFDICTPIFVGEKNRRLVFASIYTEALWDLFPDEFDLLSAVLIEKPATKKAKK